MSYSYDSNTDTYHLDEGKWKRKKKQSSLTKGKRELIDKMVASHRKKKEKTAAEKRAEKIDALERNPSSWKNLS